MKKIIYLLNICAIVLFASCESELDNWYSATFAYDGRYIVATTCEEYSDDDTSIEDGLEAMIYNTAANKENEVWVEFEVAGEAVKGKFNLTGDLSNFKGNAETKNISSNTYYAIVNGRFYAFSPTFMAVTAAGQLIDGVQLYTRVELIKGSIIPKGATTIGENISDSINIEAILHTDYVEFESYLIPEDDWKTPGVPEFQWRVKAGSNVPADDDGWDETWTLSGYRHTGYPEDDSHH